MQAPDRWRAGPHRWQHRRRPLRRVSLGSDRPTRPVVAPTRSLTTPTEKDRTSSEPPTAAIPPAGPASPGDANAEVSAAVGGRPGPNHERSGGSEAHVRNRWASVRGFVRAGRGSSVRRRSSAGATIESSRNDCASPKTVSAASRARCVAISDPVSAQPREVDVAGEMHFDPSRARLHDRECGSHAVDALLEHV